MTKGEGLTLAQALKKNLRKRPELFPMFPAGFYELYKSEGDRLKKCIGLAFLLRGTKTFWKSAREAIVKFDPRGNAIHWAHDVEKLCLEIWFSLVWMNAWAECYKKYNPFPGMSDQNFQVSYFGDNCFTRLHSCRDKLALTVRAHYCAFDPDKKEEVLSYMQVVDRLRRQAAYGLNLRNVQPLLTALETLQTKEWERIVRYRQLKIHRREPRIEIHHVAPHQDIGQWIPEYKKQIPFSRWRDGVTYDRRKINRYYTHQEVKSIVEPATAALFRAVRSVLLTLKNRVPIKDTKVRTLKR